MPGIAVIENSDELADYFTRYLEGIEFDIYPVWKTSSFPEDKYDAYILTGDYNNLSDGLLPFHEAEVQFLNTVKGKKIFASCFSHQLLGQAYGGRVEKRQERFFGWQQIFIQERHSIFKGFNNPYFLHLNGDELTVKSETAQILATAPECLYQILLYGDNVLTCQSHPEILKQEALDIIEKHRDRLSIRCPNMDEILVNTERFADDAVNEVFMGNVVDWLLGKG